MGNTDGIEDRCGSENGQRHFECSYQQTQCNFCLAAVGTGQVRVHSVSSAGKKQVSHGKNRL